MADTTTLATWQSFMREMLGKTWELFPTEAVFLAELSGVGDPNRVGRYTRDMDTNRETFSGNAVKQSLFLSGLPGAGFVSETGTWNAPEALPAAAALIKLVRALVPFTITVDAERDSLDNSNSKAVAETMRQARIALARLENLAFLGDGTGLVCNVASATGTGALVVPVPAPGTAGGANYDILLPGTVWDVATRSTGANPGAGRRRRIVSVQEAANTITFDTAQQATDGDSGGITFSANEGIYIPGSWSGSAPGTLAAQGLEQAAASSGTFEGIDKATTPGWQGTDGRGGVTTPAPLDAAMLAAAVRRGRRAGLGSWDYGLGDPAALDLYIASLQSQVRYSPDELTLKSGYRGITYNGADRPFPLVKEPMMKKGAIRLIPMDAFQLYGDRQGPDFLADDGSMWRRFARALPKEADLLDRVQLGVMRCNGIVRIDNLTMAT